MIELYEGRSGFAWPYEGPTIAEAEALTEDLERQWEAAVASEETPRKPRSCPSPPTVIPPDWSKDWLRTALEGRLEPFTQVDIDAKFKELGV